MMKFAKPILGVFLVLGCLYTLSAHAHKLNAAETSVAYNKRSHNLEIVHSFYMHDVNHLVQRFYSENPKHPAVHRYDVFAQYIRQNLKMRFDGKVKARAEFIGTQVEGNKLYVYEELKNVALNDISKISFDIHLMKDQWQPKYWLFTIERPSKESIDFVLDANNVDKVVSF